MGEGKRKSNDNFVVKADNDSVVKLKKKTKRKKLTAPAKGEPLPRYPAMSCVRFHKMIRYEGKISAKKTLGGGASEGPHLNTP